MDVNLADSCKRFASCCLTWNQEVQESGAAGIKELQGALSVLRRTESWGVSPQLQKILQQAPSPRVQAFLGSNHSHPSQAPLVAMQLDQAFRKVRGAVKQAELLLVEMRTIVKKIESAVATLSTTPAADDIPSPEEPAQRDPLLDVAGASTSHRAAADVPLDRALLMSAALDMHEQEMAVLLVICEDLALDTASEVLTTYALMWGLRPYVNEDAVREIITWV